MEDLLDLQSLDVISEDAVIAILDLWQVPPESLLPPDATEIPV